MDIKDIIIRLVNVFENDSSSPNTEYNVIYLYKDGPNHTRQTTLGRGYTESGTLWNVFQYYKDLGGKNADTLLSYRSEKGKQTLPSNKKFLNLIVDSAKNDQLFRDAEDKVFDDMYWTPAFNYFTKNGFKENLSLAVIEDSKLHSGGMLKFLTNSFSEKTPANGGDEKIWIKSYVQKRYEWLSHASELLQHTVYRPLFFLKQIEKDNWDFNQTPLIANGVKII